MTPPVQRIQEIVARHYGLDIGELASGRRSVARPRQVAMYIAKRLTSKTLPQIGRSFNCDHSTVIHAVKRIDELRIEDEDLDFDVSLLARRVLAQHQHALNDELIGWAA